jgi:cell division protein FtsB
VDPFTLMQWIILILVFLLGLILGMLAFSGRKWKHRYHDEVRAREELARENERLRRELGEMQSLRGAAIKAPGRGVDHRGPL